MFDIFRQKPLHTVVVLFPVALIATVYLILTVQLTQRENEGHIGALLDDTWIHVRFADHVAHGKGLSYNDGEITFGATSPLWIFVLASVYRLTDPSVMTQVDIAIFLSAVGYVLSVITITAFGWWLTRRAWIGFVAGLITALTGRYLWMGLSGMEITTFAMLCILAIWSHLADVRRGVCFGWRTGILAALATLARPEAYLLGVLIGLDAFILIPLRDFENRRSFFHHVRQGWRGIMAYLLLAGSYPLTSLLESGYPLPNTFRAKSQLGREFPELPRAYFWEPNVSHGGILIAFMLMGIIFFLWQNRRRHADGFIIALWEPAFVLGVLFTGAERYVVNHSRYVAPAIPLHALLATIGIWVCADFFHRRLKFKNLYYVTTVGLSALLIIITWTRSFSAGLPRVSHDVKQLRTMHIAAGFWVKDHTTPDQLIALNDVGAIIHLSDRRVLDLEGLVSPQVIDATKDTPDYTCEHDLQLARLMLQDMPRFIMVFDWFYPCLTSWKVAPNAPALQAVRDPFVITGPTVIAGGELMVYEPVFENFPVQAFIYPHAIPQEVTFEDGIHLAAYETHWQSDGLRVVLWWKPTKQPRADYHVFVHLIDENGNIVQFMDSQGNPINLQHDSEPQNNQFHMTLWRAGDIIRDPHFITIPTNVFDRWGNYQLRVGVYEYQEGQFRNLRRTDTNAVGQEEFILIPLSVVPRVFGG